MRRIAMASAVAACIATMAVAASADIVEQFEDDCSVSLWIKAPYSDSIEVDTGDIVLARHWQGFTDMCGLLDTHDGVCQQTQAQTTGFTPWVRYSSIKNSSGYFRWICGQTRERSRCPSTTKKVRFRLLGGDDEFQTQCSDVPLPAN